jgi:hypothetical protein
MDATLHNCLTLGGLLAFAIFSFWLVNQPYKYRHVLFPQPGGEDTKTGGAGAAQGDVGKTGKPASAFNIIAIAGGVPAIAAVALYAIVGSNPITLPVVLIALPLVFGCLYAMVRGRCRGPKSIPSA